MAETTVVKLDIVQSSSRDLIGSSRSIVVKDGRPFVKAMPRNELTPRLLHGSTIPGRVHDPYVQTTNESQELVPGTLDQQRGRLRSSVLETSLSLDNGS